MSRTPVPCLLRRARALPVLALVLLAGAFFGVLAAASAATPAHASPASDLTESSPADGAEVPPTLAAITLRFDGAVVGQPQVTVSCDNNPFGGAGTPTVEGDTVTVPLTSALPVTERECNVVWRLNDSNGQQAATGDFSFDVVADAAVAGAETPTAEASTSDDSTSSDDVQSAGSVSNGPIWLGRVLSMVGIAIVFGSLVLIVAAWPEGPEYVLALKFLRTAWFVGLAGSLLYVVALSAAVKGESFSSGLSPGSWFDLFDAGWGGRAAMMRIVFVAASGWVVVRPERVIDPTTNMLALGIPALAVVTLGLTNTGGPAALLGVIASIAHVLAMAVWFGGVVLLARVVLAGPGEEDLVHAVHGFSRISTPAIVITVVTGLIQLYRLDGGELFKTGHGRVLLLKTIAVAAMIFVGLTARQVARARLARASELNVRVADRMRRAFGTEAAIGLVVLMLTGWMMSFSPGKVDSGDGGGGGDWAVERQFVDQNAGLEAELFVRPGRAGINNDLRIEVSSPSEGISDFHVVFTSPDGQTVIDQPVAITGAQVAQTAGEGGGIPFNVGGNWTVEITASTPSGPASSSGAITILNADGSDPSADVNVPALPPTSAVVVDGPRLTDPPPSSAPDSTEG